MIGVTALLLCAAGAAPPQPAAPSAGYLELAEKLRQQGQFGACAVEALRHGFVHPEDRAQADERAAFCLDLAHRYRDARGLLLGLAKPEALDPHARFRLCYSEVFLSDAPQSEICGDAEGGRYGELAAYTGIMRALAQGRWQEGAARLALQPPQAGTLGEWQDQDRGFVQSHRQLRHRSPLLAAALSAVLPGAGRAYVGRWADAVLGFLLVGAPAGFGAYDFHQGGISSVGAWVLVSIGALFYLGNVYGSAIGAQVFNRQQAEGLSHQISEAFDNRVDP